MKVVLIRKCKTCGIQIEGPNWYIKDMKYCSHKCFGLSKKGNNNTAKRPDVRKKISKSLTGKKLSEQTKMKLSRIHKENWRTGKEKLNSSNWKKGQLTKEKNPCWRGGVSKETNLRTRSKWWKELRKYILKRDNYECKRCGSKFRLTVHHIIPNRIIENNNETNLIVLCRKCHMEVDAKWLKLF